MVRLALLVVLSVTALAESGSSHAANVEVLVASGQRDSDGYALHGFTGLTGGPRSVTFQASTDAIVQMGRDGARVLVRSGDPLPAPLTGTFNALGPCAVSDSGAVYFSALADSPDIGTALFRLDERGLAQVRSDLGTPSDLGVNRGGDVVLRTARRILVLRADGTLVPTRRGIRGRFRAPAVINDDGVVAFVEQIGAHGFTVIRWRPDVDLVEQVRSESSRRPPRGHVSINAHADVAFFATAGKGVGVFIAPGDGSTPVQIAAGGDPLGGGVLGTISTSFVGIDDSRRVVFLETLPDGRRQLVLADGGTLATVGEPLDPGAAQFAPRLTASGSVAWVSGGGAPWRLDGRAATRLDPQSGSGLGAGFVSSGTSLAADGTVVATLSRHAIFRDGAPVRSVVATGDVIPGAGPIVGIGGHASHGERAVFLATVEDGHQIVALASPTGPRKLAMVGDPIPGGHSLGALDGPFDWDGTRAAAIATTEDFSEAVVLVRPHGSLELLGAAGDPSPDGTEFFSFGSPTVVRGGAVVPASIASHRDDQGLFFLRHGGAHVVVAPGARAPGSGGKRFGGFQGLRRVGSGVTFVATLEGDDPFTELGVFSWEPHSGVHRLDARAHRQGFTLDGPVATQARPLIAMGHTDRDQGIFLLGRHRPRLLLRNGDPSPLGGSIAIPLDAVLVRLQHSVVFAAALGSGARSSEAILAIGEDRRGGPS